MFRLSDRNVTGFSSLLAQEEFGCATEHEATGSIGYLQTSNVDTAGITAGVPNHGVIPCWTKTIGENSNRFAEDIEHFEPHMAFFGQIKPQYGCGIEGIGIIRVERKSRRYAFQGVAELRDPCCASQACALGGVGPHQLAPSRLLVVILSNKALLNAYGLSAERRGGYGE